MPASAPNAPASPNAQNMAPSAIGRTSSDGASANSHLRPTTPTSVHSSSSELGDADIIPPYDPAAPRTLVLCFDGTGDQFDSDNSNVVKFFSLLKKDDRREQMVYYQVSGATTLPLMVIDRGYSSGSRVCFPTAALCTQAGIGTYTTPQVSTALGQAVSKILDEAVAWNLDAHVMSGYEFLMQNYEAGDKICLFGFSRGAYTARALAGMLHKVGLLPPDNYQQIPFAYKMYSRTDELGWKQSTAFKKAFSIDVDIEFIGVWDTVCSVGVIPHRLPFTASNTAIRTFRHALSLDERRAKFKANYYNRPTDWESKQGTHKGDMPRPAPRSIARTATKVAKVIKTRLRNSSGATTATAVTTAATATANGVVKTTKTATTATVEEKCKDDEDEKVEATISAAATTAPSCNGTSRGSLWMTALSRFETMRTRMKNKGKRLTEEEQAFDKTAAVQGETDVKEVWFAGCHCDVGGGSVPDETTHALSRIPLRWMIRECFRTRTGIRFHGELLKEIGLDPASVWPVPPASRVWGVEAEVYGKAASAAAKAAAPIMPPLAHQPTFAVVAPTPLERSLDDVEHAEKEATRVNVASVFPNPGSKPVPPLSAAAALQARMEPHMRDASTSTAHTLVNGIENQMLSGTAPAALVPPGWGPDPHVNEEAEDLKDARCRIYDQLAARPFWWLLELLPIEQRVQRESDHKWEKHYRFNMGHGRDVPRNEPFYVHRSVKFRMEQEDLPGGPYHPRARSGSLKPVWVD
ncbi:hypothetical protein C8Q78DRAFT_1076827 [Trametes maxima]|nr:hypothetical protein C8Q78DRAFT_1076827 [Trametes maxima]